MPAKAKHPSWVLRLRGSCPKGWSVKNLRGKVFLSVRSGAGGVNATTMTLPIAWAADTVPEAVQMITELHQLVSDGFDLRDALGRIKQPAAAKVSQPSSPSRWPGLLEEFQADLRLTSGLQPTTWKDNYAPFLDYAVMLLGGAAVPGNARELLSRVVGKWEDKPRRREIAVTAVRKFLEFCVEVKNLPVESWTVTSRVAKQMKGTKNKRRTVATITDQEILRLIDNLPDDVRCSRWKNALRLMAIYGLRPEELSHLVSREHPNTAEPAVYCTYQKVCGSTKTEPRWLMPLPLKGLTGELVEWNLAGAMAIGQLELPPLSDKYAVRTFLERQPFWHELKAKYDKTGEWLRPYSFRNSYSLRAHRIGHRNDVICMAMGHSLSTHESNYEWARSESVLEHI